MNIELIDIGMTVGGLLVANYGVKLGRAYPLIKEAFNLAEARHEAKRDGKLTQTEKAKLYDHIEKLMQEAYSILKGMFPNKTKLV